MIRQVHLSTLLVAAIYAQSAGALRNVGPSVSRQPNYAQEPKHRLYRGDFVLGGLGQGKLMDCMLEKIGDWRGFTGLWRGIEYEKAAPNL